jgi:murein DD-endopeptidase MepM/ murein hydrolase activator NlpD
MQPATPKGRGARKLSAAVVVLVVACVTATGASGSGGGGVATGEPPKLNAVTCLEQCAGIRTAAVGSVIRLDGKNLDGVDEVRLAGDGGRVLVKPREVDAGSVEAKVPEGAVSGTVKVRAYGSEAETPRDAPLKVVAKDQIPAAGEFRLTLAEATPRTTFYDGIAAPTLTYLFQGGAATDVRIAVIDRDTREVVRTWIDEGAQPNTRNSARWNGRTDGGALAANGEYAFRIGNASGGGMKATADSRFGYYKFRFPLTAKHSYGDGYGAGRGHQGQDVFAKCGATMRAARGGRVQWNKTHSAAGNYLVIDGKGTQTDFMYAHLKRRSPLQRGDRVRTGQKIGLVGETGNASGCHLHFEAWSGPGWYEGGHALSSVSTLLKAWDRWS